MRRATQGLLVFALCAALSACGTSSKMSSSTPGPAAPKTGASTPAQAAQNSTGVPTLTSLLKRRLASPITSMAVTTSVVRAGTTVDETILMRLKPTIAAQMSINAGGQAIQVRLVGNTAYEHLPQIASHDGGKSWLAIDLDAVGAAVGLNLKQLFSQVSSYDPTQTLRLLSAGSDFQSLGRSTVDGRSVIGFHAVLDPAHLPASTLSASLVAQLKAVLTRVGATREEVTTYLTDAGDPVRIVSALSTKSLGQVQTVEDVKAINIPVQVSLPPAAQTISLAQARKLGL